MSSPLEQQTEEREALQSIYEGDTNFKEIDSVTFQYKYGEEDNYKSFLVELKWGENYPDEAPAINMNAFYNRNLLPAVKEGIQTALSTEADQWLGCGMTYTLFECLKDNLEQLTAEQPESAPTVALVDDGVGALKISDPNADAESKKKEPKKEHLTKAQKRRQWERTDHKGDRERGWDWVDLVKHLSQTGGKNDDALTAAEIAASNAPALHPLNN
ncbi:RWD domain-containing protein 4 [Drosophila mauritiana]|uniref:RWD domain-containing protein 4 n=1 Tax=Drosophila mauritiana TaxID=7226 RepID=A0A6P8KRB8_DROMA|nr:RWD domain-containing protein 4 [Drosophila mauritiana]